MEIVLTTDANYLMPSGVLLKSLCEHNAQEEINVHLIVDNSVTQIQKEQLQKVISGYDKKKLFYYHIDGDLFTNYPNLKNHYLSKAAYYRLFLTDILPSEIDKVLYLDCDMLVLKSLKDMWEVDMSNYAVAAIEDALVSYDILCYNRLRYKPSKLYFNSGVMLINLKYWRETNALQQFMDYLKNYSDRVVSHDQDILNVIFQDKKLLLPITYNLQEGFLLKKRYFYYRDYEDKFFEYVKDPVILHYNIHKPWQKGCDHPRKEMFWKIQAQTIWKDMPLVPYPIRLTFKQKTKIFLVKVMEFMHLKVKPEYPYCDFDYVKN